MRIWSHLLKKSLIENFIFCAVTMKVLRLFHSNYIFNGHTILTLVFCKVDLIISQISQENYQYSSPVLVTTRNFRAFQTLIFKNTVRYLLVAFRRSERLVWVLVIIRYLGIQLPLVQILHFKKFAIF